MAKKSFVMSSLIMTLVITLGCNIHEAEARDVSHVKLKDIKPETMKDLKREEIKELLEGAAQDNVLKEIEKAKSLLGELKNIKKESSGDVKKEMSSLVKSESLLNEITDSIKTGKFNANEANIFVEKESFFYRAWKENSYDAAVPEKEKEFMFAIKRIIKLLKRT